MRAAIVILGVSLVALAAAWATSPRQSWPGALPPPLPGDDLDAWLAAREALFDGLTPGTEKAITWAGAPGARTDLAVVYIHGFSASRQEISPVPERIAQALGANYFATRLAGHGRGGAALAEARLDDWALDTAEAIAIGRRLGRRIVLMGTSTGGSLATLAALEPEWQRDIAALITVSPNYALNGARARMLDLPWAPAWLPRLAGAERSWQPFSEGHARYWTLSYPTSALFSLRAAQRAAGAADHGAAQVPMLVFYALRDEVVAPAATARVIQGWGARADAHVIDNAEDPNQHVITGEIRSPSTSEFVIETSLNWLADLPLR
ncbi:MAG: alpha/beta hydrolase [Pararhodobacter sp.]|nr:alpha/beta hydrolase [Pararhodobacter sp.]